jgi:hypothetical protein
MSATPDPMPPDAIEPVGPLPLGLPVLPPQPLGLSYVLLWIMCLLFIGFVTYMTLRFDRKLESAIAALDERLHTLATHQAQMAEEQAKRKFLVERIVPVETQLGILREKADQRAAEFEPLRYQVQTNTLAIARNQKALDTLIQRYNDWVYKKRPALPPVSKEP